MWNYFVYLISPENRLIITESKIANKKYHELMNSNGPNSNTCLTHCKMFCIGYIYGSMNGRSVKNLPEEFE